MAEPPTSSESDAPAQPDVNSEDVEGSEDLDEIFRATADKRKKQALQMGAFGLGGLLLGLGTFLASSSLFEAEGLSQDAVWIIGYGSLVFGIPVMIFAIILFVNAMMLRSRHGESK